MGTSDPIRHRFFLDTPDRADSYAKVTVWGEDETSLKLADCHRTIEWSFTHDRKGRAKLAKVMKALKIVEDSLGG